MIDNSKLKQEVGPLFLQCIDFVLILMPEDVASRTRLVLPPGFVAPPPPFPIPWVRAEPFPILNMCRVYFGMGFPKVRVYFLLKLDYLLDYDRLQAGSDVRQVLHASSGVFINVGDRHVHVATGTPSL